MKKYVPILLLLFYSCNSNNQCKEDLAFKEKFFRNICMIEKFSSYRDSLCLLGLDSLIGYIPFDTSWCATVIDAINYNEVVTDTSALHYEYDNPYSYFNQDITIEIWKKWYEQNKCTMTLKRADSIYFEQSEAWSIAFEMIRREISLGEQYSEEREVYLIDSLILAWRKTYK